MKRNQKNPNVSDSTLDHDAKDIMTTRLLESQSEAEEPTNKNANPKALRLLTTLKKSSFH